MRREKATVLRGAAGTMRAVWKLLRKQSYRSPSLITGEIEGQLERLEEEFRQVEREHNKLAPQLYAVRQGIER